MPVNDGLVRGESRIRPDQHDAMVQLRRRIKGQRTEGTERVTNNMLVRIALDILLDHQDALTGNTEEELRQSLRRHLAADNATREPDRDLR